MSWEEISHVTPTARKQHQCVWCGESIPVGTKHEQYTGKMDGDFQSNRMHQECYKAMNDLHEIDRYANEDGFFIGDFRRGTYEQR